MSESPLKVWLDRDGHLLRLRLARPKANVVDEAMIKALSQALEANRGGKLLGALLDAEGPHFSFGASVEEHLPEKCKAMLEGFHRLLGQMLDWPAPILVAVRGQCLGGGLEVAMCGSQIFAAPDAKLGQPEIKLGVMAPAASCLLPYRVSQSFAEDLLISGRSVGAEEARANGLVSVIADDPEAAALAYFDAHLAGKTAVAVAYAMRAARVAYADAVKKRLPGLEREYVDGLMQTRDALEGLNAFLAKRSPEWTHR